MTTLLHSAFPKILLSIFFVGIFLLALNIQHAQAIEPVLGTCPPGTSPASWTEGVITSCDPVNEQYTPSSENTATTVISRIINIVLGFLGLIALILFIVGGFQWMTSGGNEEKTAGAKKLMVSAIIGLAIVLGAAVISTFAFTAIEKSLTGSSQNEF